MQLGEPAFKSRLHRARMTVREAVSGYVQEDRPCERCSFIPSASGVITDSRWRTSRRSSTGSLGQSDARRVAHHSHVCPRCHEMLESLRAVIRGLGTLRRTADETVVDDVLDALRRSGDH